MWIPGEYGRRIGYSGSGSAVGRRGLVTGMGYCYPEMGTFFTVRQSPGQGPRGGSEPKLRFPNGPGSSVFDVVAIVVLALIGLDTLEHFGVGTIKNGAKHLLLKHFRS